MALGVEVGERICGGLAGLVVGDALGVPVEFMPRETIARFPLSGSQHLPAGRMFSASLIALQPRSPDTVIPQDAGVVEYWSHGMPF
ncbi:MAG: ADP-ribosylglycohydrolase family protein [Lentisphaeria bacterium]|nr:ADP-ribosylglycohydrolase family protein [Lentisphaeria bacterium]